MMRYLLFVTHSNRSSGLIICKFSIHSFSYVGMLFCLLGVPDPHRGPRRRGRLWDHGSHRGDAHAEERQDARLRGLCPVRPRRLCPLRHLPEEPEVLRPSQPSRRPGSAVAWLRRAWRQPSRLDQPWRPTVHRELARHQPRQPHPRRHGVQEEVCVRVFAENEIKKQAQFKIWLLVCRCGRDDMAKFRSCGGPGNQCIRKDYFCDRHHNCPTKVRSIQAAFFSNIFRNFSWKKSQNILKRVVKSVLLLFQSGPASDEIGCEYPDPETTPGTAGNPGDGSEGDNTIGFANLNRLSWILIIVCSGIALLLFILVFCRAQKMRRAGGRKVNFIFVLISYFLATICYSSCCQNCCFITAGVLPDRTALRSASRSTTSKPSSSQPFKKF